MSQPNIRPGTPFRRALLITYAIHAVHALPKLEQHAAMLEIGPYESRGKGRGIRSTSKRCVAHDKRASAKRRNVIRNKSAR